MNTIYAIRYASREGTRGEHFLNADTDQRPHPTAYYAWLIRSGQDSVLVDTGMRHGGTDRVPGLRQGPALADSLRQLGVTADSIRTVVLTHLHYDHAGGIRDYPSARYLVQRSEVAGARPDWLIDQEDLDHLHTSDRLVQLDGDTEIAPGITVHHVGGHTPGMQIVRVHTEAGHVVIASDASHFYENLTAALPGRILHSESEARRAFDRIHELAERPDLILPGHDPQVLNRFPTVFPDIAVLPGCHPAATDMINGPAVSGGR